MAGYNEGHHVRYGSSIHRRVFEECRKDFLRALVAHLRVRFKEMPVIGSLYRMLTPRLYKGKTLTEVQNCKQLQKAFDEVAAHFCSEGRDSPFKKEELEVEWKFILKVVWEARDATVKVKVPAESDPDGKGDLGGEDKEVDQLEEGEDSEEEEFEGPGDSECEEEEDPRSIFDKLFDVPIKTKKKFKFVEKPWEAKVLIEKVANTEDHPSQGTIFYTPVLFT